MFMHDLSHGAWHMFTNHVAKEAASMSGSSFHGEASHEVRYCFLFALLSWVVRALRRPRSDRADMILRLVFIELPNFCVIVSLIQLIVQHSTLMSATSLASMNNMIC